MSAVPKGSRLMKAIRAFKGPETLGLANKNFNLLDYAQLKG